jgi:DNA topoisomerase IA
VITSAVGHLVELRMPMGPNGKKLPWNFQVLPAIPENFDLDPIPDSEARLKQVLKLAKRKDIDRIVNACDAGREGELIFRYIMDIGKIQKPVQRLWMQSMTNNAILEAWEHLRSDAQMRPLADAAKCRSESDWLVGLNATRALTCFNSRHGGFNITAAGRVQTPTLAILAAREAEIQAFKPTPYFEVHAGFGVQPANTRQMDRRKLEKGRIRPARETRAHLGTSRRRGHQIPLRRQNRRGHRGKKGPIADRPAALRPHHAPARGPVFRQGHPADRPGAL